MKLTRYDTRGILWVLLLSACALPGAPSPVYPYDATKHIEWRIAQEKLSRPPWEVDAFSVERWQVEWKESPGSFYCGEILTDGCYWKGVITWNVQISTVIRHEAGHAILHKLKDPRWEAYEHDD